MGQMGFFDIANRYAGLDAKNDPLVKIDEVVPWEALRPRFEAAWRKPAEEPKNGSRRPGVIEALFEDFDGYLEQQGYLAMGGRIVDATIVPVPKQRNSRGDNARVKDGETPEGWEKQPAKRSQKGHGRALDQEARPRATTATRTSPTTCAAWCSWSASRRRRRHDGV